MHRTLARFDLQLPMMTKERLKWNKLYYNIMRQVIVTDKSKEILTRCSYLNEVLKEIQIGMIL